jgi:hypothetical protein
MILDCGTNEDGAIIDMDSDTVQGDTGLEINIFTGSPGGDFDVAVQITQC